MQSIVLPVVLRNIAATALTAVLVLGCSSPKLDPLPANATILAFGDSLTAGFGATAGQSYPVVLAELSGLTVVNSGVSGETTDEGLARLPDVLDQFKPNLLILLEGGNDILQNKPAAATRANLAEMIELTLARQIPVVLIGVPEKKLFSNSAPFYAELAQDYEILFDGELLASLLRSPAYKSDPIHLNAAGYRQMAAEIYDLLQTAGGM